MQIKLTYLSALGALCVGAAMASYAQEEPAAQEISLSGSFDSDVLWSQAAWTPQAPTDIDKVTLNMEDNLGSLVVDGVISVDQLTLNQYSKLLLSGADNSLTSALDITLNDNSSILVSNGATLNLGGINSVKVYGNSSFTVDNAIFNGKFHYTANNVKIINGSVWTPNADMNGVNSGDILVQDSSVVLNMGMKMQAGTTLNFTLDNSTMAAADGTVQGINFGGNVSVLNGSKIYNIDHFNVGKENGGASGDTTVTIQGTSLDNLSSVNAQNAWFNVNEGGTSKLVLAGFTDVDFTTKIDTNNTSGGNFELVFENSNNDLNVGSHISFGKASTNAMSGDWKIYTAEGATNNTFTVNSNIDMWVSSALGNTASTGVDWKGEGNVLSVNGAIYMKGSKAESGNSYMYMKVSDGGTFALKDVNIGADKLSDSSVSGLAEMVVANGGILSANNIRVNNSGVAGATAVSKLVFDNAVFTSGEGGNSIASVTLGGFNGNKQDSAADSILGGTAVLEVKNGSNVILGESNVNMIASNSADSTSVSKLIVDSSKLTTAGELKIAHENVGGIVSGSVVVEVKGENALLEFTNKGLYGGHNANVSGGDVDVSLSGSNNELYFKEQYQVFASGSGIQTGGTFDTSVTGVGNTFESGNIILGKTSSTGGKNTFYAKGDSAEQKNNIFIGNGNYNVSVNASTVEGATIENSFILAGNTILDRSPDSPGTVNVYVGNASGTVAGKASFIVKGSGNVVNGENLTVGSDGGEAIARFEGYGNQVNFKNTVYLNGAGSSYADAVGGRFEFVVDNYGAGLGEAMLTSTSVGNFTGSVLVDFTSLTGEFSEAEFLLISSTNDWSDKFNTWLSSGLYDFNLRDDSDEAYFLYDNGNMYVIYSSTVPEPAAFAAIFGLCAFAFAAYRRRRN